ALLFLVHPQHTESVAWLSERKDVLYTLFYLTALIFYVDFKNSGKKKFYFLTVLSFFFSCLSKPMAVSFPAVIILIDYFIYNERAFRRYFNKIPLVLVSILFSIVAIKFINTDT